MLSPPPGKTAEALRQVSTLPHRESDGYVFPPFLMNYDYFGGVGAIHLDMPMIPHPSKMCNGFFLQFSIYFFGYFAIYHA
jgi:hypothetical protein